MTVGENIRAARKAAGLTQKQLGERLGISYVNISQLEGGQRIPSLETLQKLADALHVSRFQFLPEYDSDCELEQLRDLLASINLAVESANHGNDKEDDSAIFYVWHDGAKDITADRVALKYSELRRIVTMAEEAADTRRLYYLGKRLEADIFDSFHADTSPDAPTGGATGSGEESPT